MHDEQSLPMPGGPPRRVGSCAREAGIDRFPAKMGSAKTPCKRDIFALYKGPQGGWRRRVGIEPTGPLLAGPPVLKTGSATRPNPPPYRTKEV